MLAATLAYAQETFKNPVVWADMPDPDVIRTGDDFWLVTTTMHLMPGAPIMHSKDLVNWETVSYLFDRLDETPKVYMQGGTVYGRGQWVHVDKIPQRHILCPVLAQRRAVPLICLHNERPAQGMDIALSPATLSRRVAVLPTMTGVCMCSAEQAN